MMTVGDLMDKLAEYDPDDLIMVDGYEGGLNHITEACVEHDCIDLNHNRQRGYGDWFGDHEIVKGDDHNEGDYPEAVIIHRAPWK